VSTTERPQRRARSQRGVTAVVIGISMMLLAAAGAVGFDISRLVFARQQLRNAVDAAAQAVAVDMPVTSASAGSLTAKNFAIANDPNLTASDISVDFFCVVAKAADGTPDERQIPWTCNPGTKGTDWQDSATYTYNGKKQCPTASKVCAIPCVPSTTKRCNAVQVTASRTVQFIFGPAINIPTGTTGAMSTVSCRGSCGGEAAPNPMNIVVMSDRTASMWGDIKSVNGTTGTVYDSGSDSNLKSLRDGLEGMLKSMTPDQQYVAFGAIHKSRAITPTAGADNLTQPLASGAKIFNETTTTGCVATNIYGNCTKQGTVPARTNVFAGAWVPVGFTKSYQSSTGVLNTSSDLYASIHNLNYANLTTSGTNGTSATYFWNQMFTGTDGSGKATYSNSGTGTHLASALKGAARYLLANVNADGFVSGLDDGTRLALQKTPRNVIIFETDGSPDEIFTNASSDSAAPLSLSNSDDIGSTDDSRACSNFAKVAANAKAAGITIITIGFGGANTSKCGEQYVRNVLAGAASTQASVTGSGSANTDCDAENSDDDLYYCAKSSLDLSSVFTAAMGQLTGGTKFMAIDGFGD
jgi:Flp pilus assembly protein TadG